MYALIANGQVARYPYPIGQFRVDNPTVGLPMSPTPEQLAEVGMHAVVPVEVPAVVIGEVAEEVTPTFVNDAWTQTWAVRPATPAEVSEQEQALLDDIVRQTQERLDAFARTRHYDDIKSACTYAGCSVPKFNTEGSYCQDRRAETWAKLYEMLAEVNAGTRPMPTGFADVEPELPALVWPT